MSLLKQFKQNPDLNPTWLLLQRQEKCNSGKFPGKWSYVRDQDVLFPIPFPLVLSEFGLSLGVYVWLCTCTRKLHVGEGPPESKVLISEHFSVFREIILSPIPVGLDHCNLGLRM